ncbi:DUF177 domain-containing protein [Prochlorococcus sp. MIT 1300]|uniref:YceD family protein n=1 Tax=Prochlorococcus sp. MIT 1300 TaxID=3096218 RepID=UPI002A7556FD|nr:DUF177 domain-containing protein [Prochlorococcus sp. MIT 1300]
MENDKELKPISIKELESFNTPKVWEVECFLHSFNSLWPITGWVSVEHLSESIIVKSELQTLIELCCDRCSQQFEHKLFCNTEELIRISTKNNKKSHYTQMESSHELAELNESLDSSSNFDPERWIFEHVNLELPISKHCGEKCPMHSHIEFTPKTTITNKTQPQKTNVKDSADPRLAILKKLQKNYLP